MRLRDLYKLNSAWGMSTLLTLSIDGVIMHPMAYSEVLRMGYDILEVTSFYNTAVDVTNPCKLEIDFEDEWTDFTKKVIPMLKPEYRLIWHNLRQRWGAPAMSTLEMVWHFTECCDRNKLSVGDIIDINSRYGYVFCLNDGLVWKIHKGGI